MAQKVMVLTLDGYNNWNVTNTEFIEVEEFNSESFVDVYFDGEAEVLDSYKIDQPNEFTITFMCEEGGYFFVKQ